MSYLEVCPAKAKVSCAGGTTKHTIYCVGTQRLAFKVTFNKRHSKYYEVRPVYGYLKPGESCTLELFRLLGKPGRATIFVKYTPAPTGHDPRTPFLMENEVGKVRITLQAVRGIPCQNQSRKVERGPVVRLRDNNAIPAPLRKASESENASGNYDDDSDESDKVKPKQKPAVEGKVGKDIYDDSDGSDSGGRKPVLKKTACSGRIRQKTSHDVAYDNLGPEPQEENVDENKLAKEIKPRRHAVDEKAKNLRRGAARREVVRKLQEKEQEKEEDELRMDKTSHMTASEISDSMCRSSSKNQNFNTSKGLIKNKNQWKSTTSKTR